MFVPNQQQNFNHNVPLQPEFYNQPFPSDPRPVGYNPTSPQHTSIQQTYGNFVPSPAVDVAMQYGTSMIGQGTDFVEKKKWTIDSGPSGPAPPCDNINAPDLYIPIMSFLTYILLSGAILGIQGRFSPEQLGILSSETLVWLAIEILLLFFLLFLLNVTSNMSYIDLIAYSGYKFVSIIVILLAFLVLDQPGYYFSLLYLSLALSFFLIRTLKLKILPHTDVYPSNRSRRGVYLLISIALLQPVMMWWLTHRLLMSPVSPKSVPSGATGFNMPPAF